MPTYASVEDVEREAERYDETVLLFAILEEAISEADLDCQIEPKCIRPDGSECRPDILVLEEDLNTIIEHKASLSSNQMSIIGVFEKIHDKYGPLRRDGEDDQLGVLFPDEDRETVSLVTHLVEDDLLFSTFALKHEPRIVILRTMDGTYRSQKLSELMKGEIKYDFLKLAKYKLIRASPPTPLAADIVWNLVLLPLYGKLGRKRDESALDYNNIVEEASTLIKRRNRPINATAEKVVNTALSFLSEIEWLEYRDSRKSVRVYPKKSMRIGEIRKWFCKKWYEMKQEEESEVSDVLGDEKYEQLPLLRDEENDN